MVSEPVEAPKDHPEIDGQNGRVDLEAPWRCRLRGVVWWRLPGRRAREVLATQLADGVGSGRRPALTVGALVEYLDTPVGPYREVLAGILLLGRGLPVLTVPFIAVDSRSSVEAGRRNWSLPKTLCAFGGTSAAGGPGSASGPGWRVAVRTGRPAPGLPAPARVSLAQARGDGEVLTSPVSALGRGGLCRVDVDLSTRHPFSAWFPVGRCWGAVVPAATVRVGEPRA